MQKIYNKQRPHHEPKGEDFLGLITFKSNLKIYLVREYSQWNDIPS